MLKWVVAAIGVLALSIAISVVHLRQFSTPTRPTYDAAAFELNRQIDLGYEPVSLVRLLAAPERYDGRKVRVSGFVTLGFEDLGLHLDESAYEAGLRKNALWLHPPAWLTSADMRRLNRHYGEVAGTFEASQPGLHDLYSGSLTKVRRIAPTFTQSALMRLRVRKNGQVLMQQVLSGWFLTLVGWTGLAMLWALTRRRS